MSDFLFHKKWHMRHESDWEILLAEFRGQPDVHYLEIGVYEGRSSCWMMEKICTHPTSTGEGIDHWLTTDPADQPQREEIYGRARHNLGRYGSRFKLHRGISRKVLTSGKFRENSKAIIYVDGDHSSFGTIQDAVICWPLLKKGGIMIFDDYLLGIGWRKATEQNMPKLGIDTFLKIYLGQYEIPAIRSKTQMYLRKLVDEPDLAAILKQRGVELDQSGS